MLETWWPPREIIFNRKQVIWLLGWLPSIREGIWPVDPQGSGYTDAPISKRARTRRAPFETPCQVAAELDARLARCGLDRYLLEDCYTNGVWPEDLSQKLGIDVREISRRLNSALEYISGWKRKRYSYREFKGHRRGALIGRGIP